MPQSPDILFSDRFQIIYEYLGMFCYIYYGRQCKGIETEEFIEDTQLYNTGSAAILGFLRRHDLINEHEGLLHLNREKFFNMTMWDLLLMAEPWLEDKAPPGEGPNRPALKKFARSEKLCNVLSRL